MTVLLFIAFISLAGGALILLGTSPFELMDGILKPFKRTDNSIKSLILGATQTKKLKRYLLPQIKAASFLLSVSFLWQC